MSTSLESAVLNAQVTVKDEGGVEVVDRKVYQSMDQTDPIGVKETSILRTTIAQGDDVDLAFDGIAVGRMLVVEASDKVRVTLNAGAEYIEARVLILTHANLTAVNIENQSGGPVSIFAAVVGE